MNWNGSRETLDHLIAKRVEPNKAVALQTAYNQKRRNKILSALNTRPMFQTVSFEMNAAGQTSPYRDYTESLAYDFIITGFKADVQTRDIIIRRTEDEKPIVYVGDETNLYLRADDICGMGATNGGGQLGTFYFPDPIPLLDGQRLAIEMFKTDTTVDAEEANIVLVGLRVFDKRFGEADYDPAEKERAEALIAMRECPRTVFLKQLVEFDTALAGGEARNLYTPECDEPLLVRGVRTNLRQSVIELGIEGEPRWTVKPTPIWGICGEDELVHDNYTWFSKPVYLHSKRVIEIDRITNGIESGGPLDAQTDNFITWICETV